ncbi:class I poly(R)-hydroxyalkanoic acid synthase [Blastochloris tepida]|uniref:Class I poly(R)-hydroxyalkanoic acid synthase n=1 Tax=Blastochloris tepida TaxID=2233851 RepID=A0A348G124_9HYPH|nr:class I poly(R)-hydroxyalkanoic acid synthase [Blastochloris tepida]
MPPAAEAPAPARLKTAEPRIAKPEPARTEPAKTESSRPEPAKAGSAHPLLPEGIDGRIGGFDPEEFARNLGRLVEESGHVMASYLKPREKGQVAAELTEETADMIKTLGHLAEYWMADPQRTVEAQTRLITGYMDLWRSSLKRLAGEPAEPAVTPDPRDLRFKDPEWSSNQFFDFLKQAYLITAGWAEALVKDAKDIDDRTRQKADFYMRQLAAAISPSNFVLTNPEVLRETLASSGENLVRGMKMLAEDIEAGRGSLKIRQSDPSRFEVGKNLANTPGKVIFQNELMQLIQYSPVTETVLKTPIMIVPPWINKYYVLDLNPEKSFIRWCVENGLTVFTISWVNPDSRLAQKGFDDYVTEGPLTALDIIGEVTGEDGVHAIGYCVGGTLLSVTLAHMAHLGDRRIKSATLFTTQVDFTHAGDLKIFVDDDQVSAIERKMAEQGYLSGNKMAMAFNLLRSNDLIWPYVVNNYLKGKAPFPFDLLYWNSDSTRMPAANHSFYLRNCYLNNTLTKGKMVMFGHVLNLKDVTIPIFNLATREDHIAPARSAFLGSRYFGGKVDFVLAGSGHIAGVVNPPAKQKYQFWTGPKPAGSYDTWLKHATEHPGSWWPYWLEWIRKQGSTPVPARIPGTGRYPPIEDAPGSYVKMKD